jgi:acyl-CoA thioesterase
MQLAQVMQGVPAGPAALEFVVGDDWLQGRSAFGGLQAAFGVAAMRRVLPVALPLRTLQVTFVAPVPPGPVQARAQLLRVGRSATQAEAALLRDGARLAVMTGVFGAARESRVAHLPQRAHVDGDEAVLFRYREGVTPAFTQHFAARWLVGGLPFSASGTRHTVVELDLLDTGPCSDAHVLALADYIPPVALSLLAAPAPGSSLTWMLELYDTDPARLPLAGWRVDSEMVAARDGYTSQSNRLWGPDGQLVALSRQSMVVFG